ncbi:MAG: 6,7-dimethyl-8-ribityllumazine synthase [Blastochloris sp.]|nr:6,7-dimethyl-8-ribityllumazine synthase [Blastochloris sp.]
MKKNSLLSRVKNPTVKIGIVASLFNQQYVDGLLSACLHNLPNTLVTVLRVPGAFEIPLSTQRLLQQKDIAAVITFGVIWQGKTAHADLIGSTVTQALMDLMLKYNKPVLHQILMVTNEKQARERCFGTKLNRGSEAAEAVLQLLQSEN